MFYIYVKQIYRVGLGRIVIFGYPKQNRIKNRKKKLFLNKVFFCIENH